MNYDIGNLRADLRAGIVSAIVVLPLALAFGVVSGLGPIAGLWGAVAVGLLAAVAGGTRVQISAATAPVALAVSFVLVRYADSATEALAIIFIAGIIQVLFGLLRIGSLFQYTPHSVTVGFRQRCRGHVVLLAGAAVHSAPIPCWAIRSIRSVTGRRRPRHGLPCVRRGGCHLRDLRRMAEAVAQVRAAGGRRPGMRNHPRRMIFEGAPRIADVIEAPSFWAMEMPGAGFWGAVGAAMDHRSHRLAEQPAERLGRRFADRAPARSEPRAPRRGTRQCHRRDVRRSAGRGRARCHSVQYPGRSTDSCLRRRLRVAALVLIIVLSGLIDSIPYGVLAGILLWLGLSLIDWRLITHLYRVQPEHVLVMLLTLGLTVFVDLLVAIAAGIVARCPCSQPSLRASGARQRAVGADARRVFFADSDRVDVSQFDAFSARVGMVKMRGSFTVASSNRLRIAISKDIVEHEVVILDFTETSYVDDSAALVVEQLIDAAMEHDTECIVIGVDSLPSGSLQSLDVLHSVPGDHFVASFGRGPHHRPPGCSRSTWSPGPRREPRCRSVCNFADSGGVSAQRTPPAAQGSVQLGHEGLV